MFSDSSYQYVVMITIMLLLVNFYYHCIVTFSVLLWPAHCCDQYIFTFSILLWPIHRVQYIVVTNKPSRSVYCCDQHIVVTNSSYQYVIIITMLFLVNFYYHYCYVQCIVVTSTLLWPIHIHVQHIVVTNTSRSVYCCDQYTFTFSILLWSAYCCDQYIFTFSILLWSAYCCDQYIFTFSVFLYKYCTTNSTGVTESLRSSYYFCLPTCCLTSPSTQFLSLPRIQVATARLLVLPWLFKFTKLSSQNKQHTSHNSLASYSLLTPWQNSSSTSINIQASEYFSRPGQFLLTKLNCILIGFVCPPRSLFFFVMLQGLVQRCSGDS